MPGRPVTSSAYTKNLTPDIGAISRLKKESGSGVRISVRWTWTNACRFYV